MLTEPELVVSDGSDDWWLPTAEPSTDTRLCCMTISCPMIGGHSTYKSLLFWDLILHYLVWHNIFYQWSLIFYSIYTFYSNQAIFYQLNKIIFYWINVQAGSYSGFEKDDEFFQPILWVWKANQMLRCKGQVFHVMRGSMKYSKEGIELLRNLPFTFSLWAQNCVIL